MVFDETYAENPLVNVLCLGMLPAERLVLGRASGVGNLAVLLGSSTGRDGIGGASVLASAGFGEEADDAPSGPSVQVGDPFEEKRLIEACLELLDRGLAVGVQDLGAAGITGATSRDGVARPASGMDVYVSEVPQREPGMEPYEVHDLASPRSGCSPSSSPSTSTRCSPSPPSGRCGPRSSARSTRRAASACSTGLGGEVLADMPAKRLDEDAPLYDRPRAEPADLAERRAVDVAAALGDARVDVAGAARPCSPTRAGCSAQYDHQLFLNTVEAPGRRRRRAAAEAPDHRRRHRPGASPSPPTATTGGAPSIPGVGTPRWLPRRC